ncbi:MAG: aminoglycoside phosphotransferase family protein [Petrimonas sp.]|uniref:phosphotransferase enzyme family protein n=1 Tax=Petrimonas sp. TaxID=2023866 RepID=UPI000964A460|nr:aminoglycoside phosphotransferase family protein [Petrimonas sp.]OJV36099.1 MAG: aminoglycoside phosphotransferase [Bacteroidia bacterium 43-41]
MSKLKEIVAQFTGDSKDIEVKPLGAGHINDSYKVKAGEKEYVLQRINHSIFKNVPELQSNILRVTMHIRQKLMDAGVEDIDRKVLTLVPTSGGKLFYQDAEGNYWRMMDFIKDSKSYDEINPELAYRAGLAFGDFQRMLADLPGEPLFETIPNFHNIESRLETFRDSVRANKVGRLVEVRDLVNELEARADEMCKAERMHREGKLIKRTNHCDTKVNNILFDKDDQVLCVVDLDTVMPGYVLSDFGDFIRTGANKGAEDDPDLDRVSLDLAIFEGYTKGYLENATSFLTDVEIENLAFGAKLLTYMQTVRFLTDYIDGDTYYKIAYGNHNLVRSKAQFKFLQSLEQNFDKMQKIVLSTAAKSK